MNTTDLNRTLHKLDEIHRLIKGTELDKEFKELLLSAVLKLQTEIIRK